MTEIRFSDRDEHSEDFIQALKEGDVEELKKIPKSDLHNHAPLGLRFADFNSRHEGRIPPPPDYMQGIEAMADYLEEIVPFMQERDDLEYMLRGCVQTAFDDGVTVLEASFDCTFLRFYDKNEDYFAFIEDLQDEFAPELELRPDLGVARILSPQEWEEYVPPCLESGVFQGIDLYDQESVNDLDLYRQYYDRARSRDLKIKAHVGEFCSPEQIEETIEALEPEAIQHGIRAVDSENTLKMIEERDITLNICPTSNVRLGAVERLEDHPLPDLYDRDIAVTVNTDDLLIFDSTASGEYLKLFRRGLLSAEELDHIRRIGLAE